MTIEELNEKVNDLIRKYNKFHNEIYNDIHNITLRLNGGGLLNQFKSEKTSSSGEQYSLKLLRDNVSDVEKDLKSLKRTVEQLEAEIKTIKKKENSIVGAPLPTRGSSSTEQRGKNTYIEVNRTHSSILFERYAKAPESDGYFKDEYLSDKSTNESLYVIKIFTSGDDGEFQIIENSSNIRAALNQPNQYLFPACDYDINPSSNIQRIRIKKPGIIKKDSSGWRITSKTRIEFE